MAALQTTFSDPDRHTVFGCIVPDAQNRLQKYVSFFVRKCIVSLDTLTILNTVCSSMVCISSAGKCVLESGM